jgi:MerR family transcriptional regulator/heat shock protein HspR
MAEYDSKGVVVEAVYTISIAARMVGVHAQTLRYYERAGMVKPARSQGQIRFYSPRDIERLRQIKTLIDELGVNLAGVDVILRLTERMVRMGEQMKTLQQIVKQLHPEGAPDEEGDAL